jgi:cyclopropane fatty-acyl-phospholipid synthase-like methyltransferase
MQLNSRGLDHQHWETRFAGEDYFYGTAPNAFLKTCRPLLPPSGRTLAIADGEGRNGVFLAECGLEVTSLDFSATAQVKAQALAAARGVRLDTVNADLLAWDWPEAAYDVVVAIFFQFLMPVERDLVFDRLRRALKPGGLLLLEGYRSEQIHLTSGGPRVLENLYTRELLATAFADFSSLTITETDSDLAEGLTHRGLAALIDLVGRRPS